MKAESWTSCYDPKLCGLVQVVFLVCKAQIVGKLDLRATAVFVTCPVQGKLLKQKPPPRTGLRQASGLHVFHKQRIGVPTKNPLLIALGATQASCLHSREGYSGSRRGHRGQTATWERTFSTPHLCSYLNSLCSCGFFFLFSFVLFLKNMLRG